MIPNDYRSPRVFKDESLGQRCEICGELYPSLTRIYKQLHGEYKWYDVCPVCAKQHERDLEMCRENFRRQFGEN